MTDDHPVLPESHLRPAKAPSNRSSHRTPGLFRRILGARSGRVGTATVALVAVVAGLVLGSAVSNARRHGLNAEPDLATLVRQRQASVLVLEDQVDQLSAQVTDLTQSSLPDASPGSNIALSRVEVTGPGVEVILSDAAKEFIPDEGANFNDLVVHQQDIDAVVNALWRGGAEAITVQGVRLAADTRVQCVGNVILVGARSYAPPYRIAAIGDPKNLNDVLDADANVAEYRRYAVKYQMEWAVNSLQSITMPPASQIHLAGLASPITQE